MMEHAARDRRPGLTPPPKPRPKGPRFSHLARRPSRFFDFWTSVFLIASTGLVLYALDRNFMASHGVKAIATFAATVRASVGF
jgi:hypothetical protein